MWKKFLAASAVASGIIGLLGGGSAFAATDAPYNPGDVLDITSGDYTICYNLSDTMDLSGPVMVRLWGPKAVEYELEPISPQDLGGGIYTATETCKMTSQLSQKYTKMQLVLPMGLSGVKVATNGGTLFSFDFSHAVVSDRYLRSYGSSASRINGVRATVNFVANGGSGAMDSMSGFGPWSWVTLPKNTLTRTGYKFAGWNTKADGTGTSYSDGGEFQVTPQMIANEPIELYAQWIEDKAVLDSGTTVNVKMKKLAGANSAGYDTVDEKIREIRTASALPAGFDTNDNSHIVSSSGSPFSIYAWFDDGDYNSDGRGDGIVYLYTDASKIETNNIPWFMFYNARSLSNISALSSWDTSGAGTMARMFYNTSSLSNISALSSWNTSNVWDISYMFDGASSLTDISALSSWDTSKVQNMKWMFHGASSLSNISALSSWNTSSVTSASAMFAGTKIANVNALETKQYAGNAYMSWDTSSMTDMSYMFDNCALLSDISALSSWNTSNVKNMSHIFYMYDQNSSLLSDISALSSWNTSNVTDMSYMLGNTKITNVNALETKRYAGKDYVSWDTSNVLDMSWVFVDDKYLTDISALSSWNTSSVTKMDCMFNNASSLSNISALSSWNTSNVEDMHSMFNGADSLTDVSALAGWDVSSVTDMSYMFSNVPARPLPSWYHE